MRRSRHGSKPLLDSTNRADSLSAAVDGEKPAISSIPARLLALTVFAVCLAATILACVGIGVMTRAHDQSRFRGEVRWTTEAIEQRLAVYLGLLRSAASAFAPEGELDLQKFRQYAHRLRLREFYPGVQGIGYAQRARAHEIEALQVLMHQAAHTEFSVRPPGQRPEYFPIVCLEPMDLRNREAIGFDMFSETVRNEAMQRARDSGQPAASGKVTLVQEIDKDKQAGFLVYVPVFRETDGLPSTVDARRERLAGFVYSPFRAADMFRGIFGDQEPILHFEVFDGNEPSEASRMYISQVKASSHPAFTEKVHMRIEGRTWALVFKTSPAFEAGSSASLIWWALLSGLLVSCTVAGITFSLAEARTRAEVYSRQLAEAQQALQKHADNLESTVLERTSRLRETVAELEAFSYSLSHDMRAPLRSIQSFSQFVVSDYGELLPAEAHDYLARVIAASRRMDQLIYDVLSYTRLSRQEIKIHAVDVTKLVSGIIRERPDLQSPQVELEIGALPSVQGNEASLTQCITNLLSNAVKFVAPGVKPNVRIYGVQNNGLVRITVEDNGIGIEQKNLGRVFELFERPHTGGRYEGTGLGLAIARKAVERMSGKIGVESQPGAGSKFWVELPAAANPGCSTTRPHVVTVQDVGQTQRACGCGQPSDALGDACGRHVRDGNV